MTTTRWKLTAGGLVLALGGLAAVAGVPARSCQADHKAGPAMLVEVPIAPVTYSAPVPVTRTAHQPGTEAVAPVVAATPEPPQIPAVTTPAEATVIPLPDVALEKKPEPKAEPKPAPKEEKVFDLKIPAASATPPALPSPPEPVKPVAEAPKVPEPAPTPPLLPEPKPEPKPEVKPLPAPVPAPAPEVKPVASTPAPTAPVHDPLLNAKPDPAPIHPGEKKLKVLLQMGDDRPRFEVRDGEEVYLKVICDKVDVKSPSDRGETMSTLRATGHVTFVTPGGEGTCEELTVIPGTGQVVVTGHVSFKYNWGKVETTVSGEKMTFRLGSTPGVPVETVSRIR